MQYIFLLIILYLYIYNPVFTWLGFGLVNVMMATSLLYAFFNIRKVVMYLKSYREEFVLSILMLLYVTAICAVKGDEQIGFTIFLWIISTVLVPIWIIEAILKKQKKRFFFDTIILVGFIASVISCTAVFSASFNSFLRSIQVDRELTDYAMTQLSFRYFGLAINLSNAYGYVQGILASLCLLRLKKSNNIYILYFVTFVISVVVNARTGLVPIALTLAYTIIKYFVKFDIRRILWMTIGSSLSVALLFIVLSKRGEVFEFVLDFWEQIGAMIFSDDTGFQDSAYYTMLRFPETLSGLIFGEGRKLIGSEGAEGSDIGYVNQIFIGGLFFASLLLIYEYIVYRKIMFRSNEKVFSTIFFVSILIFNYKGVSFYASSAFIKLWMLYYFILVHNKIHLNKIPI